MSQAPRTPPLLTSGDAVRIVALSRAVTEEEMAPAIEQLSAWGLQVETDAGLYARSGVLAGTDEHRVAALQAALADERVKAIFFARGGYGASRVVDQVDWSVLRKQPKWLVGFSDVTILHLGAATVGVASLHGTMPYLFARPTEASSVASLRQVLMEGRRPTFEMEQHPLNRTGEATGRLVGGNLSLLAHAVGTATPPAQEGDILFIEELSEYLYHVDRMMVQLRRSGTLGRLSGLVVGTLSDMQDNPEPFGPTVEEIIRAHAEAYAYPIAFGLPVGHQPPNHTLPLGLEVQLSVQEAGSQLKWPNWPGIPEID